MEFPENRLGGPVRDTAPYRAIPFRDSIAEGGIAPICLVLKGYRASIAEIPLLRGGGGVEVPQLHGRLGYFGSFYWKPACP